MSRSIRRLALVGSVAAVGAAGGMVAVSAATGSPSTPPGPSSAAHQRPHPGIFRMPKVAGKVVSDTSSGGLLHQGVLVIQEPDGTDLTLNLTSHTKAWCYQGVRVKPVSLSPSSVPAGTVVVVAGRGVNSSRHVALRILDLGFKASPISG